MSQDWFPTSKVGQELGFLPLDDAYHDAAKDRFAPGDALTPKDAKDFASAIALRGVGHVVPNPLVGAVLVDRHHRFLSAGAHLKLGEGHAEVEAIESLRRSVTPGHTVDAALSQATMYVTLEPCAHVGRTPSCALMLKPMPLKKVVVAALDVNKKVAGQGMAILNQNGIDTEVDDDWGARSRYLREVFEVNQKFNRPYYALKVATDHSAVFAGDGSQRFLITGERARAHGHFLRFFYGSVLVGAKTAILDDVSLDARFAGARHPTNKIVLDPHGEAAAFFARRLDSSLLHSPKHRLLWILSEGGRGLASQNDLDLLVSKGVELIALPYSKDVGFAARELDNILIEREIFSVLLEGGAGVYEKFMAAGRVDKLHWYLSPRRADVKCPRIWAPNDVLHRINSAPIHLRTDFKLGDDVLCELNVQRDEKVR